MWAEAPGHPGALKSVLFPSRLSSLDGKAGHGSWPQELATTEPWSGWENSCGTAARTGGLQEGSGEERHSSARNSDNLNHLSPSHLRLSAPKCHCYGVVEPRAAAQAGFWQPALLLHPLHPYTFSGGARSSAELCRAVLRTPQTPAETPSKVENLLISCHFPCWRHWISCCLLSLK